MISRLKKEWVSKPITNNSIILQTNLKRKSTPFFAALSIWIKKLKPNRKAKILMNLPIIILFPIHRIVSSHTGNSNRLFSDGSERIPKCWIMCIRMTPNRAKPLRASNTFIRFSGADNDIFSTIIL
jgi:hypothetical protein